MPLPVDYNTVPVRGKYVYLDGTVAEGSVKFTGKVTAISDSTDTIVLSTTIQVDLVDGQFTANLPATDDPDILPNGWTYKVEESFNKGGGRTFEIELPLSSLPGGVDLSSVATLPAGSSPTAFVTLAAFNERSKFQETWVRTGTAVPTVSGLRWKNGLGRPLTIHGVWVSADTAPTGADLIVDVNKNGTTIFTTQANRPRILAGQNDGATAVPDITAVNDGDHLMVVIDAVGSTVAGADVSVGIIMS